MKEVPSEAAPICATSYDQKEQPMTIQDIERAIGALSSKELDELLLWLDDHYNTRPQPIDSRIQADLAAGRLDDAILQVLDDEKNGRVQPL